MLAVALTEYTKCCFLFIVVTIKGWFYPLHNNPEPTRKKLKKQSNE